MDIRSTTAQRPAWLKKQLSFSPHVPAFADYFRRHGLHTICADSRCPNSHECYRNGHASFLILGDVCTRHCAFCAVRHGSPGRIDNDEPARLARAVKELGLRYAVITSVTRDDLPDGGAAHYGNVVREIRTHCPEVGVEILIPDFKGSHDILGRIIATGTDVIAHNMEMTETLFRLLRPGFDYRRSLEILTRLCAAGDTVVKSGFMVGIGESVTQIYRLIDDIADTGCHILTIGQYLSPCTSTRPVSRYVSPAEFDDFASYAEKKGFRAVASGPFVRSSYRAHMLYARARKALFR